MVKLLFFCVATFFIPPAESPVASHPFYTSVVEIEHNKKEKSLEVICRIFTDDFESILRKNYNTPVDLFNDGYKNANTLIADYISKHLGITADGSAVPLKFVGYERKQEACWCYFEAPAANEPKKINIVSSLMYDFTDKQFNLYHVTVNGNRKSTKLDYPAKTASFEF